jgi:hypothetical protein
MKSPTLTIGDQVYPTPDCPAEQRGTVGELIAIDTNGIATVRVPIKRWISSGFGGRSQDTGRFYEVRISVLHIERLADAIYRSQHAPRSPSDHDCPL